MAWFKVLPWHLPGGTWQNHRKNYGQYTWSVSLDTNLESFEFEAGVLSTWPQCLMRALRLLTSVQESGLLSVVCSVAQLYHITGEEDQCWWEIELETHIISRKKQGSFQIYWTWEKPEETKALTINKEPSWLHYHALFHSSYPITGQGASVSEKLNWGLQHCVEQTCQQIETWERRKKARFWSSVRSQVWCFHVLFHGSYLIIVEEVRVCDKSAWGLL